MDCVFCKIIKKEIPSEVIYEDKKIIVFLDIAPVHPGHCLVVSKEHYSTFLETPDDLACYMLSIVKKVAKAVITATNAQGVNIGINNGAAAGQIVPHTHYHIIPRFSGDGLTHWPQEKYKAGQMKTVAEMIRKEFIQ